MKRGLKVLVLEDDEERAKAMMAALAARVPGIEIKHCGTLIDGLEAITNTHFDAVFSDLGFPLRPEEFPVANILSGVVFVLKLRTDERTRFTKVLVYSSEDPENYRGFLPTDVEVVDKAMWEPEDWAEKAEKVLQSVSDLDDHPK